MPKMKTHRGLAKRVKVTGSGRVKYRKANHSHILTKKNAKRRRRLRQPDMASPSDLKRFKGALPDQGI